MLSPQEKQHLHQLLQQGNLSTNSVVHQPPQSSGAMSGIRPYPFATNVASGASSHTAPSTAATPSSTSVSSFLQSFTQTTGPVSSSLQHHSARPTAEPTRRAQQQQQQQQQPSGPQFLYSHPSSSTLHQQPLAASYTPVNNNATTSGGNANMLLMSGVGMWGGPSTAQHQPQPSQVLPAHMFPQAPSQLLLPGGGAAHMGQQQQQQRTVPQMVSFAPGGNDGASTVMVPQTSQPAPIVYDEKVHVMCDGRYIPDQVLGCGTYGQVVRCFDQRKGAPVAVKIAHRDPAYRKSALTEANILSRLSHTGDVVNMTDVFEDNGRVCIATELLFKNLYEVQRARSFDSVHLSDLRAIAATVFRALASLHQLGAIHCDIKPENVMLRNNDFRACCLIDFGAVRMFHENQYYDVQSLWYRAPEVLAGVPYTQAIDSWGVGCLLYELHTGGPLLPGDNAKDQMERIIAMCGAPPRDILISGANMNKMGGTHLLASTATPETVRQRFTTAVRPHACASEGDAMCFADLLTRLLSPNPEMRLSCTDALSHPFFTGRTTPFLAQQMPLAQTPFGSYQHEIGRSLPDQQGVDVHQVLSTLGNTFPLSSDANGGGSICGSYPSNCSSLPTALLGASSGGTSNSLGGTPQHIFLAGSPQDLFHPPWKALSGMSQQSNGTQHGRHVGVQQQQQQQQGHMQPQQAWTQLWGTTGPSTQPPAFNTAPPPPPYNKQRTSSTSTSSATTSCSSGVSSCSASVVYGGGGATHWGSDAFDSQISV